LQSVLSIQYQYQYFKLEKETQVIIPANVKLPQEGPTYEQIPTDANLSYYRLSPS